MVWSCDYASGLSHDHTQWCGRAIMLQVDYASGLYLEDLEQNKAAQQLEHPRNSDALLRP